MKKLFAALAVATMALGLSACTQPVGTIRGSGNAVSLYIDGETGCHYVKAEGINGGLTPRLDSNGRPICGRLRG